MEYGIRRAEEEWESYGVKVSVLTFDQYSKVSFEQAVSRLQEMTETVDGVIVGTLFKEAVIQLSEHLDAREIPYVYVDSDIEEQGRLAYYGTDSVAGERLEPVCYWLPWPFREIFWSLIFSMTKAVCPPKGRNAIPVSCNT